MVDMSRLRVEDLERSQDMNRVRRVYRSHAGMSNRCRPQSAKSAVRLSGSARRPLKSAEFDRLKNPRALVRPKSAGPTIGNSQSAPDVGWTVAGKLHIPNNAAGFIKSIADTSVYDNKSGEKLHKAFEALQFKSDMSFPWQLEQRAIEEAEETAATLERRGVPIKTSGHRLPHEMETDRRVEKTLLRVQGFKNQDKVSPPRHFEAVAAALLAAAPTLGSR